MAKNNGKSLGKKSEKAIPALTENNAVTSTTVDTVATTSALSTDITIQPRSMYTDRLAGAIRFDRLFGDTMNLELMIRTFREDGEAPSRIGAFYRSLKIAKVLVPLMGTGFIRASDVQFTVMKLVESIQTVGGTSAKDAVLLADHMVPILRKAGFNVMVPERFMTRTEHGRRYVTVPDLKNDAAAQYCAAVIDKAKITTLGVNRYNSKVLAEMVSVDLRSVGSRMLALPTYSKVFDDAVIAVRAHLDRSNDVYSFVPDWLRDHTVIADFATNLTFITAAFDSSLPDNPTLQVGETDMANYLDALAATLKASTRYKDTSLKALVSELSLSHGFDYNEDLAFASIAHNVVYQPGIITAVPEVEGKEVIYLDHIGSRVAEIMMSHDNGMFSMRAAEEACFNSNSNIVNDPNLWPEGTAPFVETITAYTEYLNPSVLIALVTAERVAIRATVDADRKANYLKKVTQHGVETSIPDFVFSVRNDGKRFPPALRSQMLDKNFMITLDPDMAVLSSKSFEATSTRENVEQLPDESVFEAHLLAVDAGIVQKINQALDYDLTVGSQSMKGKFFLRQLDSLRTVSSQCVLVNSANIKMVNAIMTAFLYGLQTEGDLKTMMVHNGAIYNAVLDMAEKLSPNFREEIHTKLISLAMVGVAPELSVAMRATFGRSMFAIQVDILALRLYLLAIGAVNAADIVNVMTTDEGFQLAMSQRGSSRRKSNSVRNAKA